MNHPRSRTRSKNSPARRANSLFRAAMIIGGAIALALASLLVWSLVNGGTSTSGGARATPEVTSAAKLKVDRDKIDLGDVKLGNTVQAAFVLSNAGNQPLQITDKPYIEVLEGC